MYRIVLFTLILFCISCKDQSTSTPASATDLQGFTEKSYANGVSKASKLSASDMLLEQGSLLNGVKNGAWVTYYPDNGRVKSITNYINGKKNGIHLEFTDRGQIEKRVEYTDDIFDGKYAEYKFGTRVVKEIDYTNGKIDGFYKEYHNNGKLAKEVGYKNGVQHGPFRQYNDEETLLMEYEYKDGEKVSGGIILPE